MKTRIPSIIVIAAILALDVLSSTAFGQGTAFTYQGRLNSGGNPANGTYDLQFTLYLTNLTGTPYAGPVTNSSVAVSNGLFTTLIDFGPDVFNGGDRWLDIAVRTNGTTSFTELSPRQFLSPVPTAIYAENVDASGITGAIPAANLGGTYTNSMNFDNGANVFDGTFVGSFYGGTFVGGNFTGNFLGNGGGLYDLNSSALVGPIPNSILGNAWLTTGNAGTTPGVNFVGTTDNQPLEFHANGQRILKLVPGTSTNLAPDIIGGSPANFIAPGLIGSTIAGGGGANYNGSPATNRVLGDFNTIGGGWDNMTGSTNFDVTEATVAGGAHNIASGITSAIGGGADNVANGNNATVAGGLQNRAGYHAFVGSGYGNTADGAEAVIAGGHQNNIQTNTYANVISGGWNNSILGTNFEEISAIGGGYENQIQPNASASTIAGGFQNTVATNSYESAIGGGGNNIITTGAFMSLIAGGYSNTIAAPWSAIGGGTFEYVGDINGFIGGGWTNVIAPGGGQYSVISGGQNNLIQYSADHSVIGGGSYNVITGFYPLAGYGTIAGGYANTVLSKSSYAAIAGGVSNIVGAPYAAVPGGIQNIAAGRGSFAAGSFAQATNDGAFVLSDASAATNFSSTTSNQLSGRFMGGVRFVTGGAGMTIDGQPVAAGSLDASTLGGLPPAAFASSSGSTNYIQNQNSALQPATFAIAGNAQVAGLFRSGSESGTSEPPSPAGLVIRRINSTSTASNSVIAAVRINTTNVITLVRDGSNGGIQIQYPIFSGRLTITAMGLDSSAASRNVVTNVINPAVAGTVQLYPDSLNVVHFECTFGDTYLSSGLTQVTLSRAIGDNYWSGNVISTYNQ